MFVLLALLSNRFDVIRHSTAIGCLINIVIIIITLLFVKLKGQKLNSIGLCGGSWIKSGIVGIVLASVFFFNNCGSYLISGNKLIEPKKIVAFIIYDLTVGFCEEIVFRGYIGTRIYGLIKTKWIAVVVVGLMFTIMHFPYRMIASGMTLWDLTAGNIFWVLNLFGMHIVWSFIYMKTNSLYGTIIPHWISDLACDIIIK